MVRLHSLVAFRLQEEGAEVIVVGAHPAGQKYTGKYGYPVKSHVNIEEFSSLTVDGLVLPGGFAPDYMRRNKHMLEAITTSIELGKPCAAICHGPWMFCSARFPNGQPVCHQRQCTSFVAIKDDLINAGAQFVDAPVVVDGPLITARTPADLIPFCHAPSSLPRDTPAPPCPTVPYTTKPSSRRRALARKRLLEVLPGHREDGALEAVDRQPRLEASEK